MGVADTFARLVISLVLFVAVIALGLILVPQFITGSIPGSLTISSGSTSIVVPVLFCVLASAVLTLVVNLVTLPFRRRTP